MDSIHLAERMDHAIEFGADDMEALERFAASLPARWHAEIPRERSYCFRVRRDGLSLGVPPAILVFRTNTHQYSVAIWDILEYLGDAECEIFECECIAEVISAVRPFISEITQIDDRS